MIYRFNKEKFNKNADISIKKRLSRHLDYIDGVEVKFEDGDKFGAIDNYVVDGEEYCLYPVLKEWCTTQK